LAGVSENLGTMSGFAPRSGTDIPDPHPRLERQKGRNQHGGGVLNGHISFGNEPGLRWGSLQVEAYTIRDTEIRRFDFISKIRRNLFEWIEPGVERRGRVVEPAELMHLVGGPEFQP
jgi:hypothetical protein